MLITDARHQNAASRPVPRAGHRGRYAVAQSAGSTAPSLCGTGRESGYHFSEPLRFLSLNPSTNAKMKIRTYQESDEDAVVALWETCGLTRPWNDPRKDIARKLTVQRELFFVGELDGALVATIMAGFEGHRGWVNYLAVAPALRGRGNGAVLVKHVEERFLAAGCPKVNLLVRASNTAVVDFYRHLGYASDEAVILGKRLIPDGPSA